MHGQPSIKSLKCWLKNPMWLSGWEDFTEFHITCFYSDTFTVLFSTSSKAFCLYLLLTESLILTFTRQAGTHSVADGGQLAAPHAVSCERWPAPPEYVDVHSQQPLAGTWHRGRGIPWSTPPVWKWYCPHRRTQTVSCALFQAPPCPAAALTPPALPSIVGIRQWHW